MNEFQESYQRWLAEQKSEKIVELLRSVTEGKVYRAEHRADGLYFVDTRTEQQYRLNLDTDTPFMEPIF